MLAAEAVKVGMADSIGSLEEIIAELSDAGSPAGTYRGGLAARTTKEISMDYATVKVQHPELLAEIESAARADGARDAEARAAQAEARAKEAEDAVVKARSEAAEAETRAAVEKLAALGFTQAQVEGLSAVFGGDVFGALGAAARQPADKKDAILAALNAAGNRPLAGGAAAPAAASRLLADAARRARAL
jgi:hypothetical protein